MGKMTGNEFLVKALQEEGVEKIFGYPGALSLIHISEPTRH